MHTLGAEWDFLNSGEGGVILETTWRLALPHPHLLFAIESIRIRLCGMAPPSAPLSAVLEYD